MTTRTRLSLVGAVTLGIAGGALGVYLTTDPSPAPPAPLTVAQASAAGPIAPTTPRATPRQGQHEGIKVHGHWKIVVKNPDGTVAQRREFENSLTTEGAETLTKVFAGQAILGTWRIWLIGPSLSNNGPATATIPTEGSDAGKFVLTRTVTANAPTSVTSVATLCALCDPNFTPAQCASSLLFKQITGRSVSGVSGIVEGQRIQVTVVISFS